VFAKKTFSVSPTDLINCKYKNGEILTGHPGRKLENLRLDWSFFCLNQCNKKERTKKEEDYRINGSSGFFLFYESNLH
jgi:hypothetical protein